MPWNKFKTKHFFVKLMGNEDAAQTLCKQLMADEHERTSAKEEKHAAVVDRLTDTSKYTGSHKERFDAEGKGKGTEGRRDDANVTGYVGNYKGEGTFQDK